MLASRHRALGFIAIIGVIIALYSFTFQCGYIGLDDDTHATAPHVLGGLTWKGVKASFTEFHGSQWIPLSYMSHMVDASLFGVDAGGAHLVNVVLHALNACLVLVMLQKLTREFWPSAVVAALFAVHPVNVEGVAWVAERKNCLSATFWLLTVIAYGKYVEDPRGRRMALVAVLLGLGLMAKPMLVTLPFVLLLLDVWPLKRHESVSWKRLILEKWPLYLLIIADSLVTMAASHSRGGAISFAELPLTARFAITVTNYVRYLGLLVWPVKLAILYPVRLDWPLWIAVAAGGFLVVVSAALWWMRKPLLPMFIGWLVFLGMLFPVGGIFQIGRQSVADRFLYLPQIALWCGLVWLCRPWWKTRVFAAVVGIVLAVLSALTFQQVHVWANNRTLFVHAAEVAEPDGLTEFWAGAGCAQEGESELAVQHYRKAVQIEPDFAVARYSLATTLVKMERSDEAIAELQELLRLNPYYDVRRELAELLTKQGRAGEAAKVLSATPNPASPR